MAALCAASWDYRKPGRIHRHPSLGGLDPYVFEERSDDCELFFYPVTELSNVAIRAAELHHEGLPFDGDRLTSTSMSARERVSAIKTPSIQVKVKAGVFQCPECQHIERNAGLHDLSIEPLRQHDIALE